MLVSLFEYGCDPLEPADIVRLLLSELHLHFEDDRLSVLISTEAPALDDRRERYCPGAEHPGELLRLREDQFFCLNDNPRHRKIVRIHWSIPLAVLGG